MHKFIIIIIKSQAAQARCINYREFLCCFAHIKHNLKTSYEKFNIVVATRSIEVNCSYINLGLLLLFLCNPGLNSWPIYTVLRLVICSVLFSSIKRSKAGDRVQSQLTTLSRTKEPRTDSPRKSQILKARSV